MLEHKWRRKNCDTVKPKEVILMNIKVMREMINAVNNGKEKASDEMKCYFIIARYVIIIEKMLKKDCNRNCYIVDADLFAQYQEYVEEIMKYLKPKKNAIKQTKMKIKSNLLEDSDKENLKILHSIRDNIAHGNFTIRNDGEWELSLLSRDENKTLLDIPITKLVFDKSVDNIEKTNLDIEKYLINFGDDKDKERYILLFITMANILNFFDSQKDNKKSLAFINTNDIYAHNPSEELQTLSKRAYDNLEKLAFEFENLHNVSIENIDSVFTNLKETYSNIEEDMGEYNYEIIRMVRNSIEHADMEAGETNLGKVELVERVYRTKFNDEEQINKYNLNIKTTDFLLEGSIDGMLEMVKGVVDVYAHNPKDIVDVHEEKGTLRSLTKICLPSQNLDFKGLNQKIGYEFYENIKKIKENSQGTTPEEDFDTFFNRYLNEKNFNEFLNDIYNIYSKEQRAAQLSEMINTNSTHTEEKSATGNKRLS